MAIYSDAGALVGTWWNQVTQPQGPRGPIDEITVAPAAMTARTDLDQAGQALGRPCPIVIGTGRVDGVYFIGGVLTVGTTTTTTTTSNTIPPGYQAVSGTMGGQTFQFGPPPRTTTTSTTIYNNETLAGYVLAYDVFERGYDLIRLEIDGAVVFDGENSIPVTTNFRFYGGRHTTVDPILTEIIGSNAGAYQNFVMIFIDGYPADSAPSISAVISNATASAGTNFAYITGTYTASNWFPNIAAYEPAEGIIYQLVYASQSTYGVDTLHVLSIDTLTELTHFPWPSFEPHSAIVALPGSNYILAGPNTLPSMFGVVDLTGTLVASLATTTDTAGFTCAMDAGGGIWLALGQYSVVHSGLHDNAVVAVFDATAPSLTLIELATAYDAFSLACPGRTLSGSSSFFIVKWPPANTIAQNNTIVELTYGGSGITETTIYTVPSGYAHGVHFDSLTGYLVVPVKDGSTYSIHLVNPVGGALVASIPTAIELNMLPDNPLDGRSNRLFPSPGHALLYDRSVSPGNVWSLDITTQALTLYVDEYPWAHPSDGIYDQRRGIWVDDEYPSVGYWTVHGVATISPLLIDLEDIITDAMSLAGFGPTDLTFEGIAGRTSYGFVVASDTTVQAVGRSLSDIYGFSWCDTGSGFYFKQAAQDDLFTIDAAFDTPDIVERDQPVMSQDEANIRTPSSVEMQYVSKEGQYKARPATFNMTTGVLNSITTPKFSTPILFNDAEAQRIVQEKFFEYQEKRRAHTLAVAPENITLLPGDIVSFPSGTRTYITRIEEVGIDLRNMGVEISARDFQTDVATAVTAVSNTGPVWTVVQRASGDVTGQTLAVSVGTVTVTAGAAGTAFASVTGQQLTVSAGTASVTTGGGTSVTADVTGQAAAVSVGTASVTTGGGTSVTADVTGQAAAVSVGTVTVDVPIPVATFYALANKTGNQTLTGVITWDAEISDGAATHDNSTNPSRFTIPSAWNGRYVRMWATMTGDWTVGSSTFTLLKNGSSFTGTTTGGHASSTIDHCTLLVSAPVVVATGDYFEASAPTLTGGSGIKTDNATWGMIELLPSSFSGAMATRSSTVVISGDVTVAWTSEAYDLNSFHDNTTNNSRLTVPSGVTLVRVSSHLTLDANATVWHHRIFKGGVLDYGLPYYEGACPGGSLISAPIAVTAGNYFSLGIWHAGGGTPTLQTSSAFCIEVLDSALQYALVRRSSNQSVPGTLTTIDWDTEVADVGGWHDNSTNPSRLTVPSGVTRVRLCFNLNSITASSGDTYGRILKNGATFPGYVKQGAATGGVDTGGGWTAILEVTAGDYFELQMFINDGGNCTSSVNNWFSIEEVLDAT